MTEQTKNKIFWTVFILLIIGSVTATYFRIYVWKDYQIIAQTSCDPQSEANCFVVESEVSTTTPEGIVATSTEIIYYKNISKSADNIFKCEQTTEKLGCNEELTCTESERKCSYEYCSIENVPEGESCYTPIEE